MVNPNGFHGQTILVTGAASGNGRAIATAFARQDAAIIIVADVRADPREGGRRTVELIEDETAARAMFIKCDLFMDSGVDALTAACSDLGGVDVLVNNAGLYWKRDIAEETAQSLDRMLAVNVRAPYLLSKSCAAMMVDRGGGAIINISSVSAFAGSPGFSAYTTSKAAVQGLTIALAAELGSKGIRVNAVLPGRINTAMTTQDVPTIDLESGESDVSHLPLGRYGQPTDIADACLFLAGNAARFITGASLVVDGGELFTAL